MPGLEYSEQIESDRSILGWRSRKGRELLLAVEEAAADLVGTLLTRVLLLLLA